MALHTYATTVTWTGNLGTGTSGYRDYGRDHTVSAPGRPVLPAARQYLHLCATHAVVVTRYHDTAAGTMTDTDDGGGHFTEVVLRPEVEVAIPDMRTAALALHPEASVLCFVAASVNFPVRHEPTVTVEPFPDSRR